MNLPILFIIPGACSLGSQITLEWLKIPYQICITTSEMRKTAAFLKINPSGKVGALKDGDTTVAENLAILLYLADKHPKHMCCPAIHTPARVKTYQWFSFLASTLHTTFAQVLLPERFINDVGLEYFKTGAHQRLSSVMTVIEEHFRTHAYFIEDFPTIVDAQAFGLLRWSHNQRDGKDLFDLTPFPRIQKFLETMKTLPAVENALMIEKLNVDSLQESLFEGYYEI